MKNLTRKVQIVCGFCGLAILSAGCATVGDPVDAFPKPYFESKEKAEGFAAAYEQIIHAALVYEDEETERLEQAAKNGEVDLVPIITFTGADHIVRPQDQIVRAQGVYVTKKSTGPYILEITVSPVKAISAKSDAPGAKIVEANGKGSIKVTIDPAKVSHMQEVLVRVFGDDQEFLDEKSISVVDSFPKPGTIFAKTQIEDELASIKNFGETFSKTFYCMPVAITNKYGYPVKVSASSILLPMAYVAKVDIQSEDLEWDPKFYAGGQLKTEAYVVPFDGETYLVWDTERMPLTMNTILSLLEFDKRQDPNYRFIRVMRLAGSIAGSTSFFITGSDYSQWVAFFAGPLTNELEKYLLEDILNNIDFITNNALGESVTVPENETVVKYVFFPKGDILGVHTPEAPARVFELREDMRIRLEGQLIIETEDVTADKAPAAEKSQ